MLNRIKTFTNTDAGRVTRLVIGFGAIASYFMLAVPASAETVRSPGGNSLQIAFTNGLGFECDTSLTANPSLRPAVDVGEMDPNFYGLRLYRDDGYQVAELVVDLVANTITGDNPLCNGPAKILVAAPDKGEPIFVATTLTQKR